jgi:polysaccharide export outer membrane protein
MLFSALPAAARTADDVIGPGDALSVIVWNQPAFSGLFTVEGDGAIAFPLLGRIRASGLTVRALEAEVTVRLSAGYVNAPQVRIQIERRAGRVFVMGEVHRPGAYLLTPGLTLAEALALAGWVTPRAGVEAAVLRTNSTVAPEAIPAASATPIALVDISRVEGLASGGKFALSDGDVVLVRAAPAVHVTGPVVRPGEYAIEPNAQVIHVLSRAGGLRENASDDHITIVRSIDGTQQEHEAQAATRLVAGDVVVVGERSTLRLKPRVGLANIGYDSNIHHAALVPQDDFVATVRGGLNASARSPHLAVDANGTADFLYFQQHDDQRSVNVLAFGRLDVPMSRLVPYVEAGYDRGLAREQFDMNRRLHRTAVRGEAGGSLGLTRDTSLKASAGHLGVDYAPTGSDPDAGNHSLDRDENRVSLAAQTAVSTLTTVGFTVFGERARFRSAVERDSTTFAYLPGVVFGRDAAVSGRATAGYKQVTFEEPPLRDFRGLVGDVQLSRALSDHTRLTVLALRDFRYSADRTSGYYIFSTAGAGLGQWLNRAWRFDVSAAFKWLDYDAVPGVIPRTDDGFAITARVGRHTGATTLEFEVAYERRQSVLVRETFNALVAGMSVMYAR